MNSQNRQVPVDADAVGRLAQQGLRRGLVDTSDRDAFASWIHAEARGFHDPDPSEEGLQARLRELAYRRTTAVWDDSLEAAGTPVATLSGWPMELTTPGASRVNAWAISAVTVAPTHRRRGIARALLPAELQLAATQGLPVALLTATEATIYSRFGFSPAVMTSTVTIDTSRTGWAGPVTSGRIQFVERAQLLTQGRPIAERVRESRPGQVSVDEHLWARIVGLGDGDATDGAVRAIRYDDRHGVPQGFAVYRVADTGPHPAARVLTVRSLVAATDDAYAALWRYLVELDLVGTVTAPMRAVDEPVLWQLGDSRAAVRSDERDHVWVRILDVAGALQARRYSAPGRFVLEVGDPLEFAHGRYALEIDDAGVAQVTRHEGALPPDVDAIALTVNELGALYLGGVSAVTLARAGRITELTPAAAERVDVVFRSPVSPWLGFWF